MSLFLPIVMSLYILAQNDVTLHAQVPLSQFSNQPGGGNDIWGFTDANGREYAIMGTTRGTTVFDISDPTAPVEVGTVSGSSSTWRDIKTYIVNPSPGSFEAYAYVTTEASGAGIQIIDLSNVPNAISLAATYRGGGLTTAHNVYRSHDASDTYIYILGANIAGGGVVVLDVSNPISPVQVGAWNFFYAHDFYLGSNWADPAYDGSDIGLAFCGGNNMTVIDFSDKTNPQTIDNFTYPQISYSHSGWVSSDGRYVFACDELDEQNAGLNTTIRVIDLIDMQNPVLVHTWTGPTRAIDHNAFVKDNYLYLSNYQRGLTILDVTNPLSVVEWGHYDTFAAGDGASFNGAWGTFPYYDSGNVAVSDIEGGLFILRPNLVPGFGVTLSTGTATACIPSNTATMEAMTTSVLGFSQPVTFTISGLPATVNATITPNPVNPGQTAQVTFDIGGASTPGIVPITIIGSANGADDVIRPANLVLDSNPDSPPSLLLPVDMSACTGQRDLKFEWQDMGFGRQYRYQLALDPAFTTIIDEQVSSSPSLNSSLNLTPDTFHYWRIATINGCGDGTYGPGQSFFTSSPKILLVDDDDNTPDVRALYQQALDQAGYAYSVYEVAGAGANGPDLATLSQYAWVIWFSGDAYGSNRAGPTLDDEGVLASYLDGGGALFLSSQDYFFDRGSMSPFMTQHLGLSSIGSDTGNYVNVQGQNSLAAYGPLNLQPHVGSEYADELTAGDGSLVFVGDNGRGAGIEKNSAIFLGYSFATLIQNHPVITANIIDELAIRYGAACIVPSDPCGLFDLDGNGLDNGDLMNHLERWLTATSMPELVAIINCLGTP